QRVASEPLQKRQALQSTKGKPCRLLLKSRWDDVGKAGVAPHHLKSNIPLVEAVQALVGLLQLAVAWNATVHEQEAIQEQHVRERHKKLDVVTEYVVGQVRFEGIHCLGGAYGTVHL